jgi:hypothetical protein
MELNGKRFIVQPAGFEDAMELQEAVAEALKGAKLDLAGLTDAAKSGNILDTDITELSGPLETIIGMSLSVITSKRVKVALFKCCEKVLLGEDKVNREFFETPENRELYYPIMLEVVKVNLVPFFKKIGLLFGGQGNLLANFLKSKST